MRKIKVNINRPQASPEQVAGQQQFDQMLSLYKKAKYLFYAKVAAVVTSVLVVAAIAGYLYIANSENSHGEKDKTVTIKISESDPFKKTMVESQFFELDASKDTVVEGENGTVIAIPAGAFLDGNGNVFNGKVQLEIAEAASPEELIAANITTDSRYGIQNALFVKAMGDGKELKYNPDKPVLVEMTDAAPEQSKEILDGERNDNGEMSWTSRGPVKTYLVTMPLSELDFLPPYFEEVVKLNLPYRGREQADKALLDSLYYSLDTYIGTTLKYQNTPAAGNDSTGYNAESDEYFHECNCIRPSSIKTIKESGFQNTFIATREFEKRLKVIFQVHGDGQTLLNIYLNHLDQDLWISDSLVAQALKGRKQEKEFKAFAAQQLTNVKGAPATSALFTGYYSKRLKEIEAELLKNQKEYTKQLMAEDKAAQKVREDYSKLLKKRFVYRLEKFGFNVTKNGWVAIATVLNELPRFDLKVTVTNGNTYDHVHAYVVNPVVKSLYAMTSKDQVLFDGAYPEDPALLMYESQMALLVTVAYKGDQIYADTQSFKQQKVVDLKVNLKLVSAEEWKGMIEENSKYTKENQIEIDLGAQRKFYKERLRLERLEKEARMISELMEFVCPCLRQYEMK